MKYELQKQIKKEIDESFPYKKGESDYNMQRCTLNAIKLHERGKKKNE